VADPLLTVVTVTYNARESFLKTLASVRSQTMRTRLEYLVVDGASTDGTLEAIREAADRGEVNSWISEPDRGIYDAMNKAVSRARGEYLLFMNAGDIFPANATVECFFDIGQVRPDYLWGDSEVDRGGRILSDPAGAMLRFLYRQMTVCHQSLAVGTELLRNHPFDLTLKVVADYAVLCELVSAGCRGLYRPLVVSRVQDEGFSSQHFFRGLAERRSVSRAHFPGEQWKAKPYFVLLGLYMRLKIWYKERP